MRYSFWLGELTDGYEWYEDGERRREERVPLRKRARLILSMIFLLFATYISGTVVTSELYQDVPEDEKNGITDVYIPVGGSGAVNELDYAENVSKSEEEARINELVMSYIEEQTQKLAEKKTERTN